MSKTSIILTACVTVFLAQLGITMYLPALPTLAKVFACPPQDVALALSAFLIGMAAPMLVWGGLSERYGRKIILSMALLLYALCSAAMPLTHQVEVFILLRFLQGMGASGMSVMSRVMIKDHFSGAQLAKSLSWLSIAFVVSLGVGQFMGAALLAALGWQAIFLSLGISTLALLLVLARQPSPASPRADKAHSALQAYAALLRSRGFLLPALAGGLGYSVIITFNACAPFIFQMRCIGARRNTGCWGGPSACLISPEPGW
ncbi:MFS transporter [Chromobacterium paludis]|uniref:MFS transporter n=1 Tax=Chromobacterium paludis TaxID=2605945 RepID=UPI0018C878C0|nr:MFS transporter [Chromobacterium paludis]